MTLLRTKMTTRDGSKMTTREALLQSRPQVSVRSCTRLCIRDRALLQSKPELTGPCYRADLNCEGALLQSMPGAEPMCV